MIFIDAREGLSGDMLLAALLGLLDDDGRSGFVRAMTRAASDLGLDFRVVELEEKGEEGLSVSYVQPEPSVDGASYESAFAILGRIEGALGTTSDTGRRILRTIFEAEAKAHGAPPEEVHLHEIGRPQAMLNIAGIGHLSSVLKDRGAGEFVCSTVVTGGGIIVVSHGMFRVPAPASKILLEGLVNAPGDSPGERATPTGIAAVKVLAGRQSDEAPGEYRRRAVGFGTKRFAGRLGRTTAVWQ